MVATVLSSPALSFRVTAFFVFLLLLLLRLLLLRIRISSFRLGLASLIPGTSVIAFRAQNPIGGKTAGGFRPIVGSLDQNILCRGYPKKVTRNSSLSSVSIVRELSDGSLT